MAQGTRRSSRSVGWLGGALSLGALACGGGTQADDTTDTTDTTDATDTTMPDAAVVVVDAGTPDAAVPPDAAPGPAMFAAAGATYRFTISPEQRDLMDQGISYWEFWDLDAYGPVGGAAAIAPAPIPAVMPHPGDGHFFGVGGTWADDLTVTPLGGSATSYGQVEAWHIGQSSIRNWEYLPNIRVDADEYQPDVRVGGVENFRLNPGQVGTMYREPIVLSIWRALGYATPAHTFAWVEVPSAWGEGVTVPYTVMELYKKSWCTRELGGCANMWEGYGEPQYMAGDPNNCQSDVCDDTKLYALGDLVNATPPGPGFEAALAGVIDWDAFRAFQCLSWFTDTGDNYINNLNNTMVVERADGKLQFFPYSVDMSTDYRWWAGTRLVGQSQLAQGCQQDPSCFAALVDTCDALLTRFEDEDMAQTVVKPVIDELAAQGMLRANDAADAVYFQQWYEQRVGKLRGLEELESPVCNDDSDCVGDPNGHTQCRGTERYQAHGGWPDSPQYNMSWINVCSLPLEACPDFSCAPGFHCAGNNAYVCYPDLF